MVLATFSRVARTIFRRKKNYFCLILVCGVLLLLVQMSQYNEGYTPLQPLSDATSEAKRLLKFITHYHYNCNMTMQVSNRTHWPLCLEKDVGLDLDSREPKIMYTIGSRLDFHSERDLAMNHSFTVYFITHERLRYSFEHINNTHIVRTVVVPNDPADFSRNLYGQQTVNDLMESLGHKRLSLLRIHDTAPHVNIWEMLRYLTNDDVLSNVQQLHIFMYIDKLEEDLLYNWYRTLYELFYKAGLHLYHTSSADSMCLQVTMMESCMYYLSFVRNPGAQVFTLHPPADYGTTELEEERLLDYITQPQTECDHQQTIGGPASRHSGANSHAESLQFAPSTWRRSPQWPLCVPVGRSPASGSAPNLHSIFNKPCSIFRFRSTSDPVLDHLFSQEGCKVHTLEPVAHRGAPVKTYRVHSHQPQKTHTQKKTTPGLLSTSSSADDVFLRLQEQPAISLLEIDAPGHEWTILGQLLDLGILKNVSQLVIQLQLPDDVQGRHPTVLRSRYSQLRRLRAQNFHMFSTEPNTVKELSSQLRQRLGSDCCFKVGFIQKKHYPVT